MFNKKNLLLTVNVVTYNHSKYIEKCLKSIIEQKTNFSFCIRIFDDCSTDGTSELCKKFAKKYPNLIEFSPIKEHLGIEKNPYRAYQNIVTPYYLFIEGDDYRVDEYGFQKEVDILEAHPECSFCCAKTINYHNGHFGDVHPSLQEGIYTEYDILSQPDKIFYTHLMTRIVRTKYINIKKYYHNGYMFDTLQMYELLKSGHMYFLDAVVACYVDTQNGVVSKKDIFSKALFEINNYIEYLTYVENKKYTLSLYNLFCLNSISNYILEKRRKGIIKFEDTDISNIFMNKKRYNLKSKIIIKINKIIKIIKTILKMILPGLIPVFIHSIRNVIRFF